MVEDWELHQTRAIYRADMTALSHRQDWATCLLELVPEGRSRSVLVPPKYRSRCSFRPRVLEALASSRFPDPQHCPRESACRQVEGHMPLARSQCKSCCHVSLESNTHNCRLLS